MCQAINTCLSENQYHIPIIITFSIKCLQSILNFKWFQRNNRIFFHIKPLRWLLLKFLRWSRIIPFFQACQPRATLQIMTIPEPRTNFTFLVYNWNLIVENFNNFLYRAQPLPCYSTSIKFNVSKLIGKYTLLTFYNFILNAFQKGWQELISQTLKPMQFLKAKLSHRIQNSLFNL